MVNWGNFRCIVVCWLCFLVAWGWSLKFCSVRVWLRVGVSRLTLNKLKLLPCESYIRVNPQVTILAIQILLCFFFFFFLNSYIAKDFWQWEGWSSRENESRLKMQSSECVNHRLSKSTQMLLTDVKQRKAIPLDDIHVSICAEGAKLLCLHEWLDWFKTKRSISCSQENHILFFWNYAYTVVNYCEIINLCTLQ